MCTELIVNISEDDNRTVYCCRLTTMQDTLETSFTLTIIQPQQQSVSPSSSQTLSTTIEASVTMDISIVSADDPPSQTEHKYVNPINYNALTGGIIVGVVFISVVLLSLISVYLRRRKHRGKVSNKFMYNFNHGRQGASENTHEANNWKSDPETGLLIATLTSRSNPSLSEYQILLNHRETLEVPFSALDLQEKLRNGAFGDVDIYKGVLRNLDYHHRQPKPCVIKLLNGNIALSLKSTKHIIILDSYFFLQALLPTCRKMPCYHSWS